MNGFISIRSNGKGRCTMKGRNVLPKVFGDGLMMETTLSGHQIFLFGKIFCGLDNTHLQKSFYPKRENIYPNKKMVIASLSDFFFAII